MLRKRQRREAALKAAQAEVVATLGKSQTRPIEIDRRSDADFSLRTGCATPSGVSSSYHDIPTSGLPSPYAASSPITPKRDSKLQISNLVATSLKEIPSWKVPQNNAHFCTNTAGFDRAFKVVDERKFSHDLTVVAGVEIDRSNMCVDSSSPRAFAQDSAVVRLSRQEDAIVRARGLPRNMSFVTKEIVASPMQCIASSPQVPQIMQNIRSDGHHDITVIHQQVRRSSRLLSSAMRANCGEVSTLSDRMKGVQRRTISKSSGMNEGLGANALVALAAAASSVPPSPLTPESRYSTTSRSRSLSPDPRRWPAQGDRVVGSSQLGMKTTRGNTAELSGGTETDIGQSEQGNGNE